MFTIISDLKDYFQVNYDDKKKQWVLNIQKPLNDDVIKKNNELVLIMTAQADDFEAGIATLVIELEKDITSGPTFKKAHYEVDYPKSGTGTIDTDIDFENVKDVSKLKIITDSKSIQENDTQTHPRAPNYTLTHKHINT